MSGVIAPIAAITNSLKTTSLLAFKRAMSRHEL